jgi:signal transduction histidine kinase
VRLDMVVHAVVDDHLEQAAHAGVKLTLEPALEAFWVRGDNARLTQVVGNLLRNAIKFSAAGQEVTLGVRREPGGSVCLSVRDDGEGIAPEFIESLFDPFTQDDRHRYAGQAGLGLGLSIARGLAELHGGKVTVASRGLALGSEFMVTLPAVPAPAATAG